MSSHPFSSGPVPAAQPYFDYTTPASQIQHSRRQEGQTLLNNAYGIEPPNHAKDSNIRASVKSSGGDLSLPLQPAQLGRKGWYTRYIVPIFDVIATILPLVFIAMGILAKLLDRKSVVDYPQGLDLIVATRYGVTIYPIIFAALTGNFLQSAAGWLLERGATVMVMEQLLGSQALFGAIRTQFMLNHWNLKAVLIVVLWALSPLGGQGTLRLIEVGERPVYSASPVWYLNSTDNPLDYPYFISTFAPTIDVGNVKIPRIESLSGGTPEAGIWYPMPEKDVIYTSLVGIPIKAIPQQGNSSFTIKASYFNLNCPDRARWVARDDEIVWSRERYFSSKSEDGPKFTGHIKSTNTTVRGVGAHRFNGNTTSSIRSTFSIGTFGPFPHDNNSKHEALEIILQSFTASPSYDKVSITSLDCTLAITNVDCLTKCNGEKCKVTSMSLNPNMNYPDYTTILANDLVAMQYFDNLVVAAGYYNSLAKYTTNSLPEQYMRYGSSPLAFEDRAIALNISLVTPKQLEERFMRVLNTYWIPSLSPMDMVGVPSSAEDMTTKNFTSYAKVFAQVTTLEEIYICSIPWFIVLLASSFTLFACSLAGLVLKYFTKGPEILGHFSTLARDCSKIKVPEGGSTLDGFQRARLLRDFKVRLGDERGNEGVGHVVIASVGGESLLVGLQRGRFYD